MQRLYESVRDEGGDGFEIIAFPVKVHRGSAGWTRAVAILDD